MAPLDTITDALIEAHVGPRNMVRGRDYADRDTVFAGRRTGQTLSASCLGSRPKPYHVEIILGAGTIDRAVCTCPVGGDGRCKHVAAVLLACHADPDRFVAVESLDEALGRRSKEELIALIERMIRHVPALAPLAQTPLPAGEGRMPGRMIDAGFYYRQAMSVFQSLGVAWESSEAIANELELVCEIGDELLEAGDLANASAVYEGVSAAVLERYEELYDEESEVAMVVQRCVGGMAACLAPPPEEPAARAAGGPASSPLPAARREAVIDALFTIYRFDVDLGGMGLGDAVPSALLAHVTAEERRRVAAWAREAMQPAPAAHLDAAGADWMSRFRCEEYGGLLLDLEADVLDDEAYIDLCRRSGRILDLVAHLLAGGQVDEVLAEARMTEGYQLPTIAEMLVQHGHGDAAEQLVEERTRANDDARLLGWLVQRYKARGNRAAALDAAMRRYRRWPSLEGYQEIRELAGALQRWDEVQPELMRMVETNEGLPMLRIQILLAENELDAAVEALPWPMPGYMWSTAMQVAAAAEERRPEIAIALYQRHAEDLTDRRGRSNYQLACHYLGKAHSLHLRRGSHSDWERYIDAFRQEHRRLRALQEELTAARLVDPH